MIASKKVTKPLLPKALHGVYSPQEKPFFVSLLLAHQMHNVLCKLPKWLCTNIQFTYLISDM